MTALQPQPDVLPRIRHISESACQYTRGLFLGDPEPQAKQHAVRGKSRADGAWRPGLLELIGMSAKPGAVSRPKAKGRKKA